LQPREQGISPSAVVRPRESPNHNGGPGRSDPRGAVHSTSLGDSHLGGWRNRLGQASDTARFGVIDRRTFGACSRLDAILYVCYPRLVNGYDERKSAAMRFSVDRTDRAGGGGPAAGRCGPRADRHPDPPRRGGPVGRGISVRGWRPAGGPVGHCRPAVRGCRVGEPDRARSRAEGGSRSGANQVQQQASRSGRQRASGNLGGCVGVVGPTRATPLRPPQTPVAYSTSVSGASSRRSPLHLGVALR
jgi:hypothetical protein